jgi:preprotein translocase subunit SecB
MQIQFKELQVTSIQYKSDTFDKLITDELKTTLNLKTGFSDDNNKIFSIIFTLKLINEEFQLEIEAIAHFGTIESINEDFKNSPFLKINAPAIAYPYLRAFISTLILNMGFSPVVLPTVNFVAMNKQTEKK